MDMNAPAPKPTAPAASSKALIAMFLVTLTSVTIVVFLLFRPSPGEPGVVEEVLSAEQSAALNLHRGDVVNATGRGSVTAEEGRWYYVVIDDMSRDGASGVARIGGLITFVRDVRPGDHVVVEVTRLRRSAADADVIERLTPQEARSRFPSPSPSPMSAPATADERPLPSPSPASGLGDSGEVHTAVVRELGRHGDGVVKLEGKVVFLPGAEIGEEVTYVMEEDRGNFSIGRVLDRRQAPEPSETPVRSDGSSADDVVIGAEFTVTVSEQDRKAPTENGVVRIGGLVVFVPGTQPGDVVRIRIVDRAPRFALSEVLERLTLDSAE